MTIVYGAVCTDFCHPLFLPGKGVTDTSSLEWMASQRDTLTPKGYAGSSASHLPP